MASSKLNEGCDTRKEDINPKKSQKFESFASPGFLNKILLGSFRDNIRFFLQNFADIEDYTVNEMPIWCTLLVTEIDGVFPLYTVEETVQNSVKPYCDHCKLAGWGHHFVCKRKYHFIIPANENWNKPLHGNFAEFQNHNLYGLIHCNGYGHLICINGSKDNTNFFIPTDIMKFWNRLCTVLRARKISVRDESRKGPIELRLILSAAYGHSRYAKWGYKFSDGISGITEQEYLSAIQFLSCLDLDEIISDFKKRRSGKKIKDIIDRCREMSDRPLVTLSELLQFMLNFESRFTIPISNSSGFDIKTGENTTSFKSFVNSMVKGDCRWSAKRLEGVLIVIVNLLKEHKANDVDGEYGMSRHELREEARKSIGDTGLIDFVLKCIKCFQVENQIVRRTINPYDRLVEFTIHDIVKEAEPKWPISIWDSNCRWSRDKLEHAGNLVVSIFRANKGSKAMPWQELRDKAGEYIGDTDLIDFLLKSLDKSTVGNQIVYRTINHITKSTEFDLKSVVENFEMSDSLNGGLGLNLSDEMLYIYKNVLLGYSELNSVSLATRLVLDNKQFVKEWPIEKDIVNQLMTLNCKVFPSFDELDTELTRQLSPGEVVVVPPSITIGELKVVAQCALRDTYCIMDKFVVNQIGGLKGLEYSLVLTFVLDPGAEVWVRGSGLDLVTGLRYEDGSNKGTKNTKVIKCRGTAT